MQQTVCVCLIVYTPLLDLHLQLGHVLKPSLFRINLHIKVRKQTSREMPADGRNLRFMLWNRFLLLLINNCKQHKLLYSWTHCIKQEGCRKKKGLSSPWLPQHLKNNGNKRDSSVNHTHNRDVSPILVCQSSRSSYSLSKI